MATCRTVITDGWHDSGRVDLELDPTSAQANDGLRKLQDIYRSLVSHGSLGRFTARNVTGDHTVAENERVSYTSGTPTITRPLTVEDDFNPNPSEDANVDNTDRPIHDLAISETAKAATATYIFDAGLNAWVAIEGLTLSSEAPLCGRFREAITALLARKVAGAYVTPDLERNANRGMLALTGGFSAEREIQTATYF